MCSLCNLSTPLLGLLLRWRPNHHSLLFLEEECLSRRTLETPERHLIKVLPLPATIMYLRATSSQVCLALVDQPGVEFETHPFETSTSVVCLSTSTSFSTPPTPLCHLHCTFPLWLCTFTSASDEVPLLRKFCLLCDTIDDSGVSTQRHHDEDNCAK